MCRSWSAAWSSIGTRLSLPRKRSERGGGTRGSLRSTNRTLNHLALEGRRHVLEVCGIARPPRPARGSAMCRLCKRSKAPRRQPAPARGACVRSGQLKAYLAWCLRIMAISRGSAPGAPAPRRWCRHPRSRRRQPQGPAGRARVTWSIACSLPRWIEGAADLESSLAVSVMEQPRTSLAPTLLVAYQLAYWRQTTLQVLGARRPVGPARSLAGRKSYKHRTRRKP